MRKALIAILLLAASANAQRALTVRQYTRWCVAYYARAYHLDPALVRAVIQVESQWNPAAVSSAGAMGLMQLMPATARRYGVTHPFWIHENVRAGTAYLADLIRLFHGNLALAMAAYNAGERRVLARGTRYANKDVYSYVTQVAARYRTELHRGG